jgi:hypothetical protein
MTPADARRIVADYLVGRRVSRQDLEQACAELNSDAVSRAPLVRELGPHDPGSGCERFRANLAAFSELPESEQRTRMPAAAAHATACAACRAAYWEVRPHFMTTLATATRQAVRRLANHIEIAVERVEGLVEGGLGPVAVPSSAAPGLATLADPDDHRTTERSWQLRDEETGTSVELAVRLADDGTLAIGCRVDGPATGVRAARIELRNPANRTSYSGELSDLAHDTLHLDPGTPGTWVIRVLTPEHVWELPVDVIANR